MHAAIAVIAVATAVVVATGSSITVVTASVATGVIVVIATDKASTHVGTLQTSNILLQEWYFMQL